MCAAIAIPFKSGAGVTKQTSQVTHTCRVPHTRAHITALFSGRGRAMTSPAHQIPHAASVGLHIRSRQQQHVQAEAVSKPDVQQRSSPITGPNGFNGWAWIFSGLTLTTGTALPALYIASHWQQVLFPPVLLWLPPCPASLAISSRFFTLCTCMLLAPHISLCRFWK